MILQKSPQVALTGIFSRISVGVVHRSISFSYNRSHLLLMREMATNIDPGRLEDEGLVSIFPLRAKLKGNGILLDHSLHPPKGNIFNNFLKKRVGNITFVYQLKIFPTSSSFNKKLEPKFCHFQYKHNFNAICLHTIARVTINKKLRSQSTCYPP